MPSAPIAAKPSDADGGWVANGSTAALRCQLLLDDLFEVIDDAIESLSAYVIGVLVVRFSSNGIEDLLEHVGFSHIRAWSPTEYAPHTSRSHGRLSATTLRSVATSSKEISKLTASSDGSSSKTVEMS